MIQGAQPLVSPGQMGLTVTGSLGGQEDVLCGHVTNFWPTRLSTSDDLIWFLLICLNVPKYVMMSLHSDTGIQRNILRLYSLFNNRLQETTQSDIDTICGSISLNYILNK